MIEWEPEEAVFIIRFRASLHSLILNRRARYWFPLCVSPAFLNHVFVSFYRIFVTKSLHMKISLKYNRVALAIRE